MAYGLITARKICNASELELFAASLAGSNVKWTHAKLKAKIERTRRLRDKNRDLVRRTRVTNRKMTGAKSGTSVSALALGEQKAKLFDEALGRLVAKLEKLNAAERKAELLAMFKGAAERRAAKQGTSVPMGGPKKRSRKSSGRVSPTTASARPRVQNKHLKAVHAKIGAHGSRSQARRDSRR